MNNSSKVIISLLVANLAATFWFGISNENIASSPKPYEQASNHQLPDFVSDKVKSDILNTFIKHFNNADFEALYDMFGPIAKAQIPREDMDKEFAKLVKYFHSIKSGTYSFAKLSEQQGSTTVYVLNYTVKLSENSEFGKIGELKITVAIDDNDYQILGIHLQANTNI